MPDVVALLNSPQAALFWGQRTWTDEPGLRLAHSPVRVLTAGTAEQIGPLLAAVEQETQAGNWVAAFVSYEGGAAFGLPNHAPSDLAPLAWMAAYDPATVLTLNPDDLPALPPPPGMGAQPVQLNVSREQYGAALDRIHEYIAAGDTYQVNYTCHARFAADWDPLAYFVTMVRSHPVPYACYLNLGEQQVLSVSPELFLQRRGQVLSSRPMKGTRKRGRTPAEDEALAAELVSTIKDRAENLMILDMVRNDLGRVGTIGSVRVPRMFTAEKYRSVWQMTSTVEVDLLPGATLPEIFAATFPGASITGAPKRHTMEIIQELEPEPRGLYCGAIGLFAPSGDFTCNLPIRTLIHRDGQFDLGIGAGILWDSQTGAEYEETLLKSRFAFRCMPDLRVFETLLLQADGQYAYLEEHLTRLAASAAYFDYPCDLGAIRKLLADHAGQHEGSAAEVVRLELDDQGRLTLQPRALPPLPAAPVRVVLAAETTDSANPLYFHKTTQRALYDRVRAGLAEAGHFEAIFANEAGELTEGTITNLFVRRGDEWLTPSLTAGLLPGIWRASFMAATGAREAALTPADLREADEVVIGNSVRGAVAVGEVVSVAGETLYG